MPALWANATPQVGGTYWNRTTDKDRVLDWSAGVAQVLQKIRAFGSIEAIARIGGAEIFVSEATGWREPHALPPGSIVHRYQRHLTVTTSDGFVVITRWSSVSLASARDLGR